MRRAGGLFALGLVLAGCVPSQPAGMDAMLTCMASVNPPGAYDYPAGVQFPTVTPVEDGTTEGAAALNACISQLAQASAAAPRHSAPLQSLKVQEVGQHTGQHSAQHSGQHSGRAREVTYTYGTPPAAKATPSHAPAHPAECSLVMSGGSGYRCSNRGN